MKRLCIIGNSHAVPLRDGWTLNSPLHARFSPTFILAGADRLKFRIEARQLQAEDIVAEEVKRCSAGLDFIEPARFDCFLIVGLFFNLRVLVELYAAHRLKQHATDQHQIVSEEQLEEMAFRMLRNSRALEIYRQLRSLVSLPCLVVPDWLVSPSVKVDHKNAHFWAGGFVPMLYELYLKHLWRISEEEGIQFVQQPPELTVDRCFTPAHYAKDSVSLRGTHHRETEPFHMNAAFGSKMLDVALAKLADKTSVS
jgi:hypothetical protein